MHAFWIRLSKSVCIGIVFVIILYQIGPLLWYANEDFSARKQRLEESFIRASDSEFEQISRRFESFTLGLPRFFDEQARDWFLNSTYYRRYSKQCLNNDCQLNGFFYNDSKEHLNVHVALVKNGVYFDDACGYNYDQRALRRTFTSTSPLSMVYDQAIIYTVPDGWSFQHFLDGIGPKLVYSRTYLNGYPSAKVLLLHGPRFDRSVREIWSLLGVDESTRMIHYKRTMIVGAHLLINPCQIPGIHPRLWHDARAMYWSLAKLSTSNSYLIYVQRTATNAKNGGRLILNEGPIIELLRDYASRHSLTYVQYDHSKQSNDSIGKQIELFYNARIIFGVHGGALSNINFAQSRTIIIEVMPYRSETSFLPIVCSGHDPNGFTPCGGYSYYVQSQLLNQSYWILPNVVDHHDNLNVNTTRLQRLLDSFTNILTSR